jgi:glycogen(starch) synthase
MRIAMVSREYPPWGCGIATYTDKTSRALAALGHQVDVISEAPKGWPNDYVEAGVHVRRLLDPLAKPREYKAMRRAASVNRALNQYGPYDIVQACEWDGEAAVYALRQRAPLVTRLATPHYLVERINAVGTTEKLRTAIVKTMERTQTRLSAQVISPSACLADVIAQDWDLERGRIQVVPTGITTPTFDGNASLPNGLDNTPFVIFFGKLETRKGIKTWIDALPRVLAQNPELVAVFAGDDLGVGGVSAQSYAMQVCAAFRNRLVFLARVPQQELFKLVARARMAVLPSLWESLANVCLEAMALGRPVVSTTGSGFAEVITDGVDGILVAPGDSAALADAVNRALADPMRLERLGAAALQRASDFNLDRMARLLVDVYERVLEDRPRIHNPALSQVASK